MKTEAREDPVFTAWVNSARLSWYPRSQLHDDLEDLLQKWRAADPSNLTDRSPDRVLEAITERTRLKEEMARFLVHCPGGHIKLSKGVELCLHADVQTDARGEIVRLVTTPAAIFLIRNHSYPDSQLAALVAQAGKLKTYLEARL